MRDTHTHTLRPKNMMNMSSYSLRVVLCRYAVDFCYIVNIILSLGWCCRFRCLCVACVFSFALLHPIVTSCLMNICFLHRNIRLFVNFSWEKGYVNRYTHTLSHTHSPTKKVEEEGNDSGFCEWEISNTRNRPTKWQAKEIMSTKIEGEIM